MVKSILILGDGALNKNLLSISVALFSLILNNTSCSALSLDLEQSIQLALKNNRTIEQAIEDRTTAKWGLSEARRNAGPTLAWSVSGLRIGGRSYDNAREEQHHIKVNLAIHLKYLCHCTQAEI